MHVYVLRSCSSHTDVVQLEGQERCFGNILCTTTWGRFLEAPSPAHPSSSDFEVPRYLNKPSWNYPTRRARFSVINTKYRTPPSYPRFPTRRNACWEKVTVSGTCNAPHEAHSMWADDVEAPLLSGGNRRQKRVDLSAVRASIQKRLTFCIFLHTISTSVMTQVIPKVRSRSTVRQRVLS